MSYYRVRHNPTGDYLHLSFGRESWKPDEGKAHRSPTPEKAAHIAFMRAEQGFSLAECDVIDTDGSPVGTVTDLLPEDVRTSWGAG